MARPAVAEGCLLVQWPVRVGVGDGQRARYGDTGTELIADVFVPLGFAALGQDFRGTYLSGGNFDLWKKS